MYYCLCIAVNLPFILNCRYIVKGVGVVIDKRVGKRVKECRERLGLTQEQFAEKIGVATNYVSTVERGGAFPRYDRLVAMLNGLEVSADAIFCDVLEYAYPQKASLLSEELLELPPADQKRILEMVELMIKQAKDHNS